MTVANALLWKVDIGTYPRKKFLEIMAQFCSDAKVKNEIQALINDQDAYHHLLTDRVNVVDLLERFPAVEMPFEVLLEVVSPLQPRYFTIASSNLVNPKSIHITVTLVEEKVKGKVFNGVCSSYLRDLQPGKDVVHCFLRKSTFDLPKNPSLPVMMIGPGTGIAPMRAFIQEGFFLKNQGFPPQNWSLYFGCRHKDVDYLYEVIFAPFESFILIGCIGRA
jgi:sulfite reductase alpha subunit-like flavoprotein